MWEIFRTILPRVVEGKLVLPSQQMERYRESCIAGSFYVYRLKGSLEKSPSEKIREVLDGNSNYTKRKTVETR